MKVTILKKMIKEGVSTRTGNEYRILNLFVKFEEESLYKRIVASLEKKGAEQTAIDRAIQISEYKDKINYTFFLNCSKFTFDVVERFGILDAAIDFQVNDQGFINAKIAIVDKDGRRVEDVKSYEEPEFTSEGEVDGWAIPTPEKKTPEKSDIEVESEKVSDIPQMPIPPVSDDDPNDLPF